MKINKKVIYGLFVAVFFVVSCSFSKTFEASNKEKLLIDLIQYLVEKIHYNPKDINDEFSERVFESLFEELDPYKRYFLQKDIDNLARYKHLIDDQIKEKNIEFFLKLHTLTLNRIKEAREIQKIALKTSFDFELEETINSDYENLEFSKSVSELKNRWRKQSKYSSLVSYVERLKEENQKGKQDSLYKMKSIGELETQTRETLASNMNTYFEFVLEQTREDWFSIYLNSIVEEFDPHSFYYAPDDKERFDVDLSGKFEGIGARLQKSNDVVEIVEVISGGPVWKGKLLEVGDQILEVAQEKEDFVSITGMRLLDAVKLIKGPKGTFVKLRVKHKDGSIEIIKIERGVVEIEETFLKSSIVEKDGKYFAVINLPKFYVDFDNYKNVRNCSSDMKKELELLNSLEIDGVLLDLRDNGGGSLKAVVDLAGLFIKEGPIVQVKSPKYTKTLEDKDDKIFWDRPLVLLTNKFSASASEIFAAAMQDYNRALIIGSSQTYGKGTVQNIIDLNGMVKNSEFGNIGALKITIQKYYRINGGSTQLEGVKSDIVIPNKYNLIDIGEKELRNPMSWDKIESVAYNPINTYDFDKVIENSKKRIGFDSNFDLIKQEAKWLKGQQEKKIYSLKIDTYRKNLKFLEDKNETFKPMFSSNLKFQLLPYDLELIKTDLSLKEKREKWLSELQNDLYIEEGLNVLQNLSDQYDEKISFQLDR